MSYRVEILNCGLHGRLLAISYIHIRLWMQSMMAMCCRLELIILIQCRIEEQNRNLTIAAIFSFAANEKELLSHFPLGEPIIGEKNEKDFIVLFGNILRLRNILTAFDKFKGQEIIKEQKLKPEEAEKYINNAFRDGVLKTTGTDIDKLMPPVSRFGGGRGQKKDIVIEIWQKAADIAYSMSLENSEERARKMYSTHWHPEYLWKYNQIVGFL